MRTLFFKEGTIPFLVALLGSAILFFGVLFALCRLYDQRQHWVVIDTQLLVRLKAEDLAESYEHCPVPPHKLQQIAEQLKEKMQAFADKHHLIVLSKGAVWGGKLPDYTEAFIDYLVEDKNKETSDAPE